MGKEEEERITTGAHVPPPPPPGSYGPAASFDGNNNLVCHCKAVSGKLEL